MTRCTNCNHKYPDELVQPMFMDGVYIDLCGVCALHIRNEVHGLPLDTPFTGEMAQQIYEDTVEYRKKKGWAV